MSNNFIGVGNSAITKNSTDCLLNLLQLNLLGGGNNSIPPAAANLNNAANILAAKQNFYHQSASGTAAAGLGAQLQSQSIIQQQQQLQAPHKIGRPIINTTNLVANNLQQQQQQQQPDIFSALSSGNELSDFKNALRIMSTDNNLGAQKPFRNGDANNYTDFSEFMARDQFYNSMQNQSNHSVNNSSNSFPIGTFSIEQTTSQQAQSTFPTPDFFNPSQTNGMSNGGMNGSSGNGGGGGGQNFSTNTTNSSSNANNNNNGTDPSQATRETGIIEKLLHSYGFIQCCERQARLFFHFSQFSGNIEHLKIGDPVEFEMTYDRRTGKPIASQVSKIAPEVVLSEERVTGTVTTEIKSETSVNGETTTGRISYENRGECFFLPYTKDDVEGNVLLRAGDKVSFQIATNQRGNLGACHIRLENPVHPVKYRGVVCSMKESFGFIERADVVKEIFFHFSEAEGDVELRPGDDVEFIIQTRNGKEVACNIARLSPGSVVFEDIGTQVYKGQVLKPLDRANPLRQTHDPLPGRIRYRAQDHSEVEVPFGDKDQKGDFTLRHGDWVQFLLATDRRDQLQRATAISLLDETFEVSGERREQGMIASLKEGFGFLRCVDRNVRLFFHFTEVLDTSREIAVGDECEFTCIQEPGASFANTRLSAIRIKHLPPGQVQFETLVEENIEGTVTREAPKSPVKSQERMEGGVITYTQANNKKTIMYFLKDCDKPPRAGDNVRFDICQVKRNKELIAVNILDLISVQHHTATNGLQHDAVDLPRTSSITSRNAITRNESNASVNGTNGSSNTSTTASSSTITKATYHGFVAVLKENFGFIETLQHDEEVFFHFSNFLGNPSHLELGQEVEYTLSKRNGSNSGNCLPAENVKILPRATIPQPKILEPVYNGVVVRPLRCINPDQQEYCGLIELRNDADEGISQHELGITSLTNKRDLLQKDDQVTFKVDEVGRAAEVTAIRKKKRAVVDSIKGQFGFLDYEVEEGKKLFFHMSEVQGNSNHLYSGDSVEFSVVTNQRNGKSSACNVVKVGENATPRPERLFSRLKLINSIDESVPRLIVIRSPKGPDGQGFLSAHRMPRIPGIFVE